MPVGDDTTSTRICTLPWQNFVVDLTIEPPRAAPCRHFPLAGNARRFDEVGERLHALRLDLGNGTLDPTCRTCPDKAPGSVSELRDALAAEGLGDPDGNAMLDALTALEDAPPPAPPPALTYRVAHTESAVDFLFSGTITLFDFLPLIRTHDRHEPRRLLDWGCGSGRIAIHLARRHPEIDLTGCDIDPDAVAWCRQNIAAGDFHVIDPEPPTGLAPRRFTTIIGYSVMTHLPRELQLAWIAELHELLVDDGVVVLTTMGRTAAGLHGLGDRLADEGIVDDRLDPTLDAVAPAGYYRSTFQNRAYVEQAWGDRFEVVEFIEAGAFGFQDIVVLKKGGVRHGASDQVRPRP